MSERSTNHTAHFKVDSADTSQLRGVLDQVEMIATGGMAHIYRARQPALDRHVVIKKLKDEYLKNPDVTKRFCREAKALASVLHQNIAHVYDFVQGAREAYILMEYIDGVDLSTVIEKTGNIPPDVSAAILLGVARGVGYIHTHHLIHRDIKPSNIRINTHGEVKLMDFGIVMDVENHSLTLPGLMVGSPSYLSPEQVLGDPVTTSADIFLLGISFYEMVTGVRPFKEDGGKTVYQKIREAEFIPVRQMNAKVPVALEKIVHRCLKKHADSRYPSMLELAEDLERYLGDRRASHPENAILKFLDSEALLIPAIAVTERSDTKSIWSELLKPPVVWIFVGISVLMLTVGFLGGRFIKRLPSVSFSGQYPPSHSIDKK